MNHSTLSLGDFHDFFGDAWELPAIVAWHESEWHLYAIGDSHKARGPFQMHPDFMQDHGPHTGSVSTTQLPINSWGDVWNQFVAWSNFIAKKAGQPERKTILQFHYGDTGAAEHAQTENDDPDNYWEGHLKARAYVEGLK